MFVDNIRSTSTHRRHMFFPRFPNPSTEKFGVHTKVTQFHYYTRSSPAKTIAVTYILLMAFFFSLNERVETLVAFQSRGAICEWCAWEPHIISRPKLHSSKHIYAYIFDANVYFSTTQCVCISQSLGRYKIVFFCAVLKR